MRSGLIVSFSLYTSTDFSLSLDVAKSPRPSVRASSSSIHSHFIPGLFLRQTVNQAVSQLLRGVKLQCFFIVHLLLFLKHIQFVYKTPEESFEQLREKRRKPKVIWSTTINGLHA